MTLRQAVIGVFHKGCWGSESTVSFPDISMQEVGPIDVQQHEEGVKLSAVWQVTFKDKNNFLLYLQSLNNYSMIKEVTLIRMDELTALLKTVWTNTDSSYQKVFKSNCLYTSPVTQEQGYEKYTIITDDPQKVSTILSQLEIIGNVKIFSIGKIESSHKKLSLTDKQLRALMIAFNYGYYTWPRKANLNDISAASNLKRRTLQETLRRAESKVFDYVKTELFAKELP